MSNLDLEISKEIVRLSEANDFESIVGTVVEDPSTFVGVCQAVIDLTKENEELKKAANRKATCLLEDLSAKGQLLEDAETLIRLRRYSDSIDWLERYYKHKEGKG